MDNELPPKVPGTAAGLDRVVMLLGNRAKGRDLKPKLRREVVELIGVYPTPDQAATFKHHLKAMRKQLADD